MKENTFTYTARSSENPNKAATFTLHNGSVSLQLGNAILEQLDSASELHEPETGINIVDWAKPLAAGAVQKVLQPLPINDFDADLDGQTFHTTAWVRTGGLRLAPITITWNEVDNPEAALAFVKELSERKKTSVAVNTMPSVLDYWASWIIAGMAGLLVMGVMLRLLKRFLTADAPAETT